MHCCELTQAERTRRSTLVRAAKNMILSRMEVDDTDGCLVTSYRGYFLQIFFSELHPLMVLGLARSMPRHSSPKERQLMNELNLRSILGSHAINDDVGCYSYRATQWMDSELGEARFYEILDRCVEEADRGYRNLVS